jgi:hypothetical protein
MVTHYAPKGQHEAVEAVILADDELRLAKVVLERFHWGLDEVIEIDLWSKDRRASDIYGRVRAMKLDMEVSEYDPQSNMITGSMLRVVTAFRGNWFEPLTGDDDGDTRFEWEPLPDGLDVPTLKAALGDRFIEVPHV